MALEKNIDLSPAGLAKKKADQELQDKLKVLLEKRNIILSCLAEWDLSLADCTLVLKAARNEIVRMKESLVRSKTLRELSQLDKKE